MQAILSVLATVFWGLLVLSLLVFFHEGGHYLAARAFGVRVTEFMLGLPCRWRLSFKSRKVGTEIGVTPLLLGGYNRISGMEPNPDELLAPALRAVCDRGRMRADELAQALGCDQDRAYALLATLADWAAVEPYYDPELGERPGQKTWPAAFQTPARDACGLTEYDRGHDLAAPGSTAAGEPCFAGVPAAELLERERSHTYLGCGFFKRIAMLVAGPAVNVVLAFVLVVGVLMVGGVEYSRDVSEIGSVVEGSLAEASGLEAGDVVSAVDGKAVQSWTELVSALAPSLKAGEDVVLTVERDGQRLDLTVDVPDEGASAIGVYATTTRYYPDLATASSAALGYGASVGSYVVQLIMPQHTMEVLSQSSSVVGISVMASEAASRGIADLVFVAAAVSMSLGFMNLLPIPPLDGGKMLIELIQALLRRELSLKVQTGISYLGLAFFVFVFVVVLRNDVLRFVIG